MIFRLPVLLFVAFIGSMMVVAPVAAQVCPSNNPNDWPEPLRPYVLLIADTSADMTGFVGPVDSCGYGNDRRSHQRCAIDRITKAFAGQVDFALMHFARTQASCGATCFGSCTYGNYPGNTVGDGCGPYSNATPFIGRRGGVVLVPYRGFATPPPADNFPALADAVDNVCTGNTELFASGLRPLAGALLDAKRYLSGSWTRADGAVTHTSPLTSPANGERACRKVMIILFSAGPETCDSASEAVSRATDLFVNGVTRFGLTWRVQTHVIDVGPGTAALDQIAAGGSSGSNSAIDAATDSAQFAAVSNILGQFLPGEIGDNQDNNCNGCVDEGYPRYGNVGQTCCAWGSLAQRAQCLGNFQASIYSGRPQGLPSLLPCTTAAQAADPNFWLLHNPGETCDNVDNNLDGQVDEGTLKCGNPAQCPTAEICDGRDNDCDGQIDENFVCNGCVPGAEVCDGCDNDCDGVADNGVGSFACGQASPPNCGGTQSCRPQQIVPTPGACVAGGGFLACANNPQTETCDGLDNDCNGIPDDNVAPVACVPAGTPGGLVFGGTSQCRRGQLACGDTVCRGFVGPTPEVSDGIDNDCDGLVEEGIDVMFRNGFE